MLAAIIAGSALSLLLQQCASNIGPRTMAAIVTVESGGDPYAIDDDDTHESYEPTTESVAIRIAETLQAKGHNFDAGIAQVNSSNFVAQGLNTTSVFDPCKNLTAGSRILADAYATSHAINWIGRTPRTLADQRLQEQIALYHAFSIYNSGSPWRSLRYADAVISAATGAPFSQRLITQVAQPAGATVATIQSQRSAATNQSAQRIVPLTLAGITAPKRTLHVRAVDLNALARTAGITQ